MADIDLEALSLSELKKMQKDAATRAISTFEGRQNAETRTKMKSVAREMGYSLAELIGSNKKTKPHFDNGKNPTGKRS